MEYKKPGMFRSWTEAVVETIILIVLSFVCLLAVLAVVLTIIWIFI